MPRHLLTAGRSFNDIYSLKIIAFLETVQLLLGSEIRFPKVNLFLPNIPF